MIFRTGFRRARANYQGRHSRSYFRIQHIKQQPLRWDIVMVCNNKDVL